MSRTSVRHDRSCCSAPGASHRPHPPAPHPPASRPLLWAAAVGWGRVGVAAGRQPATPPAGRAATHRLPVAVSGADPDGPVRGAVDGRGTVGPQALQRRLVPGRQAPRSARDRRVPSAQRALVPVRFYNGRFKIDGQRVRLPVTKGQPELWVRLARPLPYPAEQVRAVTLLADGGRLWLAVTAAVPIQVHDLDPSRVAGVDLGIIHPYAVVTEDAGLLVSGRAIRAESWLHLRDQQTRQAKGARRAPKPGQRGSRRGRRYRLRVRRVEAQHRRRVHQAHHQAAKQVIAFAVQHQVGTLVVGDPTGITAQNAGRVQNWRRRQWRRSHLLQALRDNAEQAGMVVRLVDERGTSSTCPACRRRVPKPSGRRFRCPYCGLEGHRDLVGAHNIAAKAGGGPTSVGVPALVEHRRAGIVPARRDRRRHLHDRRRRSCLASGHPPDDPVSGGRRSPRVPDLALGEDQAASPSRAHIA
jgi:IS605 OrfB family transposase